MARSCQLTNPNQQKVKSNRKNQKEDPQREESTEEVLRGKEDAIGGEVGLGREEEEVLKPKAGEDEVEEDITGGDPREVDQDIEEEKEVGEGGGETREEEVLLRVLLMKRKDLEKERGEESESTRWEAQNPPDRL